MPVGLMRGGQGPQNAVPCRTGLDAVVCGDIGIVIIVDEVVTEGLGINKEGRKAEKELIKPGGENVYPAEVEKVILQHPAIDKTVVFGVPDPKWKEGIKAVCVLKTGEHLDSKELIKFVGKRIASYKKPQYVEFVSDPPCLDDGSLDRAKIKEMYGGPQKN